MLQLKRKAGESVDVGKVRLTHVVIAGRRGVKVEAPGAEDFVVFLGPPCTQWRMGFLTEAHVKRTELELIDNPRRVVTRVFVPSEDYLPDEE